MFGSPLETLGTACTFVAIKFLILWPAARAFGLSQSLARGVAFVLSPGGEFALVVLASGIAAGIVPESAGATAMVATTQPAVPDPV